MEQDKLIIGFTGTREGMTDAQLETVTALIEGFRPAEVHHGDCVGADQEFHDLAIWLTDARPIIHPPKNGRYRAFCDGELREERDYLDRNRDIVDESDLLIATPKDMLIRHRSGTWSTIRYAMSQDKWIIVIRPDGSVAAN